MNRDGNAGAEPDPIEFVEVNVAAGLVKSTEAGPLQGSYSLLAGDSGKTRHLDRDAGDLRVMPLFQEVQFFSDGTQVQGDGVPDMGKGLLLGVSLADATGKHRAINSPGPIFIVFQHNRIIHHTLACSIYKYTVGQRNFNGISANALQTHRAQEGQNGANEGQTNLRITLAEAKR